ncbi:OLC1v1033508C1 [Oldenlandia corymbosa var. corymbosa]|uniref:OLC1v1033508C1 n=1 Tax=Oldenlandia corymbosa var. corymbosa TaxID=529605 RepID=A0AAV1CNF4_OLDCO|nr:OLC1v1033508C1 [Oldenlandia corymbosa var. corymbosa]
MSSAMAQLRCSSFSAVNYSPSPRHLLLPPKFPSIPQNPPPPSIISLPNFHRPDLVPFAAGGGGGGGGSGGYSSGGGGGGDSGGGGDDDHHPKDHGSDSSDGGFGPIGAFLQGWRSRVAVDPQFPFKVLMEELVGVTACVLGDMASRPNFGLNELDFVFSTLVVGCILNFTLMYLLAPTSAAGAAASATLPSIFTGCPPGHMFEPGSYGLVPRLGTFVYKGVVFAAVGFAAGLVGTALSNGLIAMRKKMDPNFETPNKPPPTLLNASTWALHMGISSNLRYQSLNGLEFLLEKVLPQMVFKTSVVGLRCMNNVLGGMSFVMLARLTGSQAAAAAPPAATDLAVAEQDPLLVGKEEAADEKHNLVDHGGEAAESELK